MQNKGFIFIETVIVLVVLSASLIGLYSSFSSVINTLENRKKYDNINDIYKVNIISEILTNVPSDTYTIIDSSSCQNYMNSDCTEIFNELNISEVLLTNINIQTILNLDIDIPNTMKEYLQTINKNEKSIVARFNRNSENYYASLELR